MRDIKFRAWVDKSRMIFSKDTYGDYLDFFTICRQCNDGFGNCYLMQFTGLLDKNGKEIYEGDILKSLRKYTYMYDTGYKGHIRYRQHYADYEYGGLGGQITQAKAKFCEIIGNVHDNPELLP